MKKEKKFIRVCLSLDEVSIERLEKLCKIAHCSKSMTVKYLLMLYSNNIKDFPY